MSESRNKIHVRPCPGCRVPVIGTQVGKDEDWHVFTCFPCEEQWGENTRYCLPELEQAPVELL